MTKKELIRTAFAKRLRPEGSLSTERLSSYESDDVLSFSGLEWENVSAQQIAEHGDAFFHFSAEAFCYFFPALMCSALGDLDEVPYVVEAVIGMLDRSPDPEGWDQFLIDRFCLFSHEELSVICEWITHISGREIGLFPGAPERAFDTVQLFMGRAAAR